jgi:transcriptional regulator with XRE-family HTH domain
MSEKSKKQIADRLKRARLESNLTQDELSEKAGLSTNYYARIERAEVKPSIETLEKLVKALKLKSSDILPF